MRLYRFGSRPCAWWEFESSYPRPAETSQEGSLLWTTNQLGDEERRTVKKHWRWRFDDAQSPHFAYLTDSGWLDGDAAKEAQYKWAGIPAKLVRKWTAELRRHTTPPVA
jgi:hypothetical protein